MQYFSRIITERHAAFLCLVAVVIGWNLLQADQDRLAYASSSKGTYLNVDPASASAALAAIDAYTPILEEQGVDLSTALAGEDESGFVGGEDTEHPYLTTKTKLEQTYVVQRGDTITGIADKFNLHVATIAERNNISIEEIEKIKPDTSIIIPAEDTSDSTSWLVQLNEKKEEDRQKALAEAAKKRQQAKLAKSTGQGKATTRERVNSGYDRAAGMNFIVPINHNGISRGVSLFHAGIDYRAHTGTPVRSAQDGRVIEVTGGWAGGFGNSVLIDHGGGLTTRYAHLTKIEVAPGETVGQGQEVGLSGNTGNSTGPHLHFETRLNGRVVEPF